MKKEMKKKGNKKQEKNIKKIICIIALLIFAVLAYFAITNYVFIPACAISLALSLFCICYYHIDNKEKISLIYTLFGLGIILVIFAVIYTLVNTL